MNIHRYTYIYIYALIIVTDYNKHRGKEHRFLVPAVTSKDQASGFGRYTQMDGSCYEGAAVVQSWSW